MITANQFTTAHSSFWEQCFPALEGYVRLVNSGAYERYFEELSWGVDPSRSALLSELAFCLAKSGEVDSADSQAVATIEARKRLSQLPGVTLTDDPCSDIEMAAAVELANRILIILRTLGRRVGDPIFDPEFPGCGILRKSHGDILVGDTLVEIKSVERGFRSTDFRQLITYALQDGSAGSSRISRVCLANPRKGILHFASLDQIVFDTSACSLIDIFGKFNAAVGSRGISR